MKILVRDFIMEQIIKICYRHSVLQQREVITLVQSEPRNYLLN